MVPALYMHPQSSMRINSTSKGFLGDLFNVEYTKYDGQKQTLLKNSFL